MSEDFQWKDHTPSSLIEVVSHLRKRWDDGEWKVSQVTRTLLFSALHPSVVPDDVGEYRLALGHLKQIAGLQQVRVFDLLLRTGTEPALFRAYYGLRKSLLVREAEAIFLEFCSVGRAQTALLGEDFISWSRAHIDGLIKGEEFSTPFWIKPKLRCRALQPTHHQRRVNPLAFVARAKAFGHEAVKINALRLQHGLGEGGQ